MNPQIQINVNGESLNIESNTSISRLLEILSINQELVAIALNTLVVKKDMWQSTTLSQGDKVEILQFMGGG